VTTLLKNVVEQQQVALPDGFALTGGQRSLERLAIAPVMPAGFELVVAAPEHDAGMIAQAPHLVDGLLAHVLLEGRVAGHHFAANMKSCQTRMPSSSQRS